MVVEEDVRVLEVADPGKQVNPPPSPHALQPYCLMLQCKPHTRGGQIETISHGVPLQESLASEVIPDPMEGEQTWPSEEELREVEGEEVSAVRECRCVIKTVILQQCRSSM